MVWQQRDNRNRRRGQLAVLAGHAAAILVVVLFGTMRSCRQEPLSAIDVELVHLASTNEVAETEDSTPEEETAPSPRHTQRLRTAEEIRESAQLDPVTANSSERREPVDVSRVLRRLDREVRDPGGKQVPQVNQARHDNALARYLDRISGILYEAWKQPSAAEAGGRRPPAAAARLVIGRDGTLLKSELARSSGNPAVDQTVRAALQSLRTLPSPAAHGLPDRDLHVTVRFELDE